MASYKSILGGVLFQRGPEVTFSAAWYDRFRREGRRINEIDETRSFEDDPAWLMLPLERRQVALQRLEIMLDYERHESPGDSEAEEAARRLNLTTGQFYRIRRQWREKRSIFDLVPYGKPGTVRKPRLDLDVIKAARDLITEAITRDGVRAPAEILRRVQSRWTLEKAIPSHMTLRKHIADALEKLTNVSGGLILLSSNIPEKVLETATAYGEVIAIDHTGIQVFVASEGGPVAPIATFAIDLFTSSIAGVHLSFGAPGPLQFEAVLRDAEARSVHPETEAVRPRLVFNAGGNSGWSGLLSRIEKARYDAIVRRAQRLTFGETIGALIGTSIGDLRLSSRRWMNDIVFNPGRDALISFDQLKKLVDDGAQLLNGKRIPPDIELRPLKFDF